MAEIMAVLASTLDPCGSARSVEFENQFRDKFGTILVRGSPLRYGDAYGE